MKVIIDSRDEMVRVFCNVCKKSHLRFDMNIFDESREENKCICPYCKSVIDLYNKQTAE